MKGQYSAFKNFAGICDEMSFISHVYFGASNLGFKMSCHVNNHVRFQNKRFVKFSREGNAHFAYIAHFISDSPGYGPDHN